MKKLLPYLFVIFLLGIALFAAGVRLGQHTERINKVTDLYLSLPPTATSAPQPRPTTYERLRHEGCRIEFLLPSSLKIANQASFSAVLSDIPSQEGGIAASFDCRQDKARAPTQPVPTIQMTNAGLRVEVATVQNMRIIVFQHPLTGKRVTISVQERLLPLILASLRTT